MDVAHSPPSTVTGVSFSFLTAEEVRRISVKQIVNPVLLDDLNRPNVGGLYDPALGPSDKQDMYVCFFHALELVLNNRPDARHAASLILHVLAISVTLNYLRLYSILYSCLICTTFCGEFACFVIGSK
jgi:hypothetical protein